MELKCLDPILETRVGTMYWARRDDMSYNRDTSGKPSKMTRVQFTHLNPDMGSEMYDLRRRYNARLRHNKYQYFIYYGSFGPWW